MEGAISSGISTTGILLLGLQALGVVAMFLIGFAVKKISSDSEENRKSITTITEKVGDLALKMSEHYVTKEEHAVVRERVHELSGSVTELRTLTQMGRRGTGD